MPKINRVLGFVSVSFVLFFMAKISKAGLYTAYFKTIAEVEVRNSQDLESSGALVQHSFTLEDEASPLVIGSGPDLEISNTRLRTEFSVPQQINSHFAQAGIYRNPFHFLLMSAPRAPGCNPA